MSILSEARVLWQLAKGMPRSGDHAERLNRFYAPQAEHYDSFRERLLLGRDRLLDQLPIPVRGRVVELGAGTGRNVERLLRRAPNLASVVAVDICAPLLDVAKERFRGRGNVLAVKAAAESYRPSEPVDCVYFCYSLSMMQDWRAAIDNALSMLRPDGVIGMVDFYLPETVGGVARLRDTFLRTWFRRDGVHLRSALLPYLRAKTQETRLLEARARLPYMCGLSAPYCMYLGRRK